MEYAIELQVSPSRPSCLGWGWRSIPLLIEGAGDLQPLDWCPVKRLPIPLLVVPENRSGFSDPPELRSPQTKKASQRAHMYSSNTSPAGK